MLPITKIETKTKKNFINKSELAPQWVFRLLLIGPSGSGKTNMLLNLIYKYLHFDSITIYAKNSEQEEYQELIERIEEAEDEAQLRFSHVGSTASDILPIDSYHPTDEIDTGKKDKEGNPIIKTKTLQHLLIVDDFILDRMANQLIEDYFVRARHRNVSIIYLSQSYYTIPKNIRRNANYFCIYAGMGASDKDNMFRDLGESLSKEEFLAMYNEATKEPYGFLVVDQKTTKKALKFRSGWDGIFED